MSLESQILDMSSYIKAAYVMISNHWAEGEECPYGKTIDANLFNLSTAISALATGTTTNTIPSNYNNCYCFSKELMDSELNGTYKGVFSSTMKKVLTEVHLSDVESIDGSSIFTGFTSLSLLDFAGLEITDSKLALAKNQTLKKVEFGNLKACNGFFYTSKYLTDINVPKLSVCGTQLCKSCHALTNIVIDNLEYAGSSIFYGCESIQNINMPKLKIMPCDYKAVVTKTRKYISGTGKFQKTTKSNAFYNCTNLKTVKFNNALSVCSKSSDFTGCVNLTLIEAKSENLRYFTAPKISNYVGTGLTINLSGILKGTATTSAADMKERLKNIDLQCQTKGSSVKEVKIICATDADAVKFNDSDYLKSIGKSTWCNYTKETKGVRKICFYGPQTN